MKTVKYKTQNKKTKRKKSVLYGGTVLPTDNWFIRMVDECCKELWVRDPIWNDTKFCNELVKHKYVAYKSNGPKGRSISKLQRQKTAFGTISKYNQNRQIHKNRIGVGAVIETSEYLTTRGNNLKGLFYVQPKEFSLNPFHKSVSNESDKWSDKTLKKGTHEGKSIWGNIFGYGGSRPHIYMYDDTRTEDSIYDKNTFIAHWPNYQSGLAEIKKNQSGLFIKFAYNNDAYNNHLSIDEELMIENCITILEWKNKYNFDEKLAICLLYKIRKLLQSETTKQFLDGIISNDIIYPEDNSEIDDEIIEKYNNYTKTIEHQINSESSLDTYDYLDVQIDLSNFDKNIPEYTIISRFDFFTLMNEIVDISESNDLTIENKQFRILRLFYKSPFYTTIQHKPNSQTVNAIINLIINIQGIDKSIRMNIKKINQFNDIIEQLNQTKSELNPQESELNPQESELNPQEPVLNQYETVEMKGDGACLFRAFSYFVYNKQEYHSDIRKNIVDYMNDNIEKYTIGGIKLVDDTYIDNMRKPTEFGGYYELLAFATLYKCKIEIFDESYRIVSTILPFNPITPEKTIHLKYSNRNHYDCLIPKHQ